MTILVAGATGLAGSAIVRELTRTGKPVVGISSKDVDLLDRNSAFNYLNKLKPNVVIDAAAKVGGILANNNYPVEFLSENIRIQTNLIDAAHSARVEKFVFLDTGADKDSALQSYYGSNCYWIEDKPENADLGHRMGLKSILMEHGPNMHHECAYPVVKNWREIYEIITKHQNA